MAAFGPMGAMPKNVGIVGDVGFELAGVGPCSARLGCAPGCTHFPRLDSMACNFRFRSLTLKSAALPSKRYKWS